MDEVRSGDTNPFLLRDGKLTKGHDYLIFVFLFYVGYLFLIYQFPEAAHGSHGGSMYHVQGSIGICVGTLLLIN